MYTITFLGEKIIMVRHKCFISFKSTDMKYKLDIQRNDNIDMIDKSLNKPINSIDFDYVMQKIRNDYLKDSSVTIFLIGTYSDENEVYDEKKYIKKELQASLYRSHNHGRNGILGIVLPEMYDVIYKGTYTCNACNKSHNWVSINDNTVIKEFSANYYIEKNHTSCAWSEDERYCVLVKWKDFVDDPNKYIEKAWLKKEQPISEKITVRPK